MNAAKETINYYCDDIIKDGYLGQGITAAVLDTGISLHPDFDSRIVGKCPMAGMQEWRQM